MGSNTVTLTLQVDDKGSLKIITQGAKAAAASVNTLNNATVKSNTSRNAFNKLEKGTGQLTNNSTKAFAKQAQTLSGTLVPAYATLAANVFAISAAFLALQRAAAMEQLEQGLIAIGNVAGQNLPYIAKNLKTITGEAVSLKAAMSSVALGISAGFSGDQLQELTKVAKGASLALGRDMEDALTRLVKGTAKLEPEILDELGIMVRLDTAAIKYAATLGKSVTELTQFERRQAFLNETLEQGIAKFGEIADTVEANPYDKLSASFDDLTKRLFRFSNNVLGPIVEYLSINNFALTGAMAVFASTIISKVVPALGLMADHQKEIAELSATKAKEFGASTRGDYQKSLQSITNMDLLPKGVKSLADEFKQGTIEADKLKKAIASVASGEASRGNWVLKWEKQRAEALAANISLSNEDLKANWKYIKSLEEKIATGKRDLAVVKDIRVEMERALALSGTARKASGAELRAITESQFANAQAGFLTQMQGAGILGSFKIAGKGLMAHVAIVKTATGAVNILSASWKAASLSAILFGNALLKAIPLLGQLLLIGSLLQPVLQKLFGDDEATKKRKEVIESFESLVGIGKNLTKTLESNRSEGDKFVSTLKVQVGLQQQLLDGIKAVQAAGEEERAKKINELVEKRSKLQEKMPNNIDLYGGVAGQINAITNEIKLLQSTVTEADAGLLIQQMLGQIEAMAPAAAKGLSTFATKLKNLQLQIATTGMTSEQALAELEKNTAEASVVTAFATATDSISIFNKEVNKLKNKDTTPFDDFINSFSTMNRAMKDSMSMGEEGLKHYLDKNTEFRDSLLEIYNVEHPGIKFLEMLDMLMKDRKAADSVLKNMEKGRDAILSTNAAVAKLQANISALSASAAENPIIMEKMIALQIKENEERKKALSLAIKFNDYAKGSTVKQEAEKDALEEKNRLLRESAQIEISIAGIKQQQKILSYQEKELTGLKLIVEAKQKILELDLKNRSNAGNQDVTAIDSLRLFEQEKTGRIKMAQETFKLRQVSISLEYDLLRAQTRLEQIKAGNDKKTLAIYDNYISLLDKAETASQVGAAASFGAELAGIPGEESDKSRAARNQATANMYEHIAISAEKFRVAGLETLALEKEAHVLSIKRAYNEQELETIKKSGGDTTEKELERQKLLLETLKTRILLEQSRAATAGRLGGEGAGIAAGIVAGITAAEETLKTGATSDKIQSIANIMTPFIEQMKQLGPEGEAVSAVVQGAFAMSEAFAMAFQDIEGGSLTLQNGLLAAASVVNSLANIQAAQSKSAIAGIDQQIEAEKRRDGQSAASIAKITALEKKKEVMQRKAFEKDKKMKMASTVINTASAVMATLAQGGFFAIPLAAIVAAMGAAQLAIISGSSYQGGGGTAASSAPAGIGVGERSNTVDLAKARNPYGELSYMQGATGTGTGATDYTPGAFAGIKHRYSGGSTGFMVGEQGPELFIPQSPGQIVSADDTGKIGNTLAIQFSINAIDTQGMQEALRNQRGNIISMIREAANAHGEFFLEEVNTHDRDSRASMRRR